MIKKEVLKIEVVPVFDRYAWRIVEQDETVLKRGEFQDDEIGVTATDNRIDYDGDWLSILGNCKSYDNDIEIEEKCGIDDIIERVKLINEKYGIPLSPEEYYATLEKVPFVYRGENYKVYYDECNKVWDWHWNSTDNNTINGATYVSFEDAKKFCKLFNGDE